MRALILVCAALAVIGCGGPEVTGTAEQKQMVEAMKKAGGDPNRLDASMRAKLDQATVNNPMSTASRPGGPGAGGSSGMPAGYPARAGT